MAKARVFTFKTRKPTGKWRSFFETHHDVKLDGKDVGSIDDKQPHTIRLMVHKADINEDENPNCSWKWIKLKKQSSSLDEAKQYLNDFIHQILEKYNIRKSE